MGSGRVQGRPESRSLICDTVLPVAVSAAQARAGSLLGRTWDLRVGIRDGRVIIDPPDWRIDRDQQVLNVEALCRAVLNRTAARLTRPLEPAEYDEALLFLLGEVVVIALQRWPPRRAKYPVLGAYISIALPSALIDHFRWYYGRDGHKRVAVLAQAAQSDSGSDGDGVNVEPVDERLEARIEELVLGRVDLSRAARSRREAVRGAPRANA